MSRLDDLLNKHEGMFSAPTPEAVAELPQVDPQVRIDELMQRHGGEVVDPFKAPLSGEYEQAQANPLGLAEGAFDERPLQELSTPDPRLIEQEQAQTLAPMRPGALPLVEDPTAIGQLSNLATQGQEELRQIGDTGKGFIEILGDAVSGAKQYVKETEALPKFGDMPELEGWTGTNAWARFTSLGASPKEKMQIITNNFPDIGWGRDRKGNYILKSGIDDKLYAIHPGARKSDVAEAFVLAAEAMPIGALTGLMSRVAAGTGLEFFNEAMQWAGGGEFNPLDALIGSGVGAATDIGGPAMKQLKKAYKLSRATKAVQGGAGSLSETLTREQLKDLTAGAKAIDEEDFITEIPIEQTVSTVN
jgi:hypothetical protein